MGRLIDTSNIIVKPQYMQDVMGIAMIRCEDLSRILADAPPVEAIPKDNVYKATQEMMKYEHEGFINISLARLDEILKKCGAGE